MNDILRPWKAESDQGHYYVYHARTRESALIQFEDDAKRKGHSPIPIYLREIKK